MKPLLSLLVVLPLSVPARAAAPPPDAAGFQRLVALVQYLEGDYPGAVQSGGEELEEQRVFVREALGAARDLETSGAPFVPRLESLTARIDRAEDPDGVTRDCASLVEDLVAAGGLSRSPRRPPDLSAGEALYLSACAACHAKDGSGKVSIAREMTPPPADFRAPEAAERHTPYRVFTTIQYGVTGTAMPAYDLSEEERWNLSFYVLALRHGPCEGSPPKVSLERLATATDAELARAFEPASLSCLRRAPPAADEEETLLKGRSLVLEARRLFAGGDAAGGRRVLVDAYLQGLEPVEPLLRARDHSLVSRLEAAFSAARLAAESGGEAGEACLRILPLIDQARRGTGRGFASVFWLSLLILLREGLEAALLIAALLAMLRRAGAVRLSRVVHAGWILAALSGAAAFAFGRKALGGANRELLEGLTALLAVGMLLYAALWLNDRANTRKFLCEIRERMEGALGRGSVAGLFAISFTSVFRESFETAVFLQGLAIDSPSATAWGGAAGLFAIGALTLGVSAAGIKLPLPVLFRASTALLLATAVILLGKGMHALQEVGLLPLVPVPFFEAGALGVFPDACSLGPQVLLTLALGAVVAWRKTRGEEEKLPSEGASRASSS